MVKSLEWWWHLTRLTISTWFECFILVLNRPHDSKKLNQQVGFWVAGDLSDFQNLPAVCWSCRCWARSLKLLVPPSSEVSGWWSPEWMGCGCYNGGRFPPKIPNSFGRFVWKCWKKGTFCLNCRFFWWKPSTNWRLLVGLGPRGFIFGDPRNPNHPGAKLTLNHYCSWTVSGGYFKLPIPSVSKFFEQNALARWVHTTPRWGTKCT